MGEKNIKEIRVKLFDIPPEVAIRSINSIPDINQKYHCAIEITNSQTDENSTMVDIGGVDNEGILTIGVHWSKDTNRRYNNMENVQKMQNNGLRELNTPFGKLFIEPWEWHKDNIYPYYADGRITIYDSRKDFLDYFCLDYFYDAHVDSEKSLISGKPQTEEDDAKAEEEYNKLCEMLEVGAEAHSIEEFMDWIGVVFYYAGTDKKLAAWYLSDGHPEELVPNELETNEYVNHIGNNYIIIAE